MGVNPNPDWTLEVLVWPLNFRSGLDIRTSQSRLELSSGSGSGQGQGLERRPGLALGLGLGLGWKGGGHLGRGEEVWP